MKGKTKRKFTADFKLKQGRLAVNTMSLAQRRRLIDPTAEGSIRQQCQWAGLHRSAYYYQPLQADKEDLVLMPLLDEQYLLTPYYGYRKMRIVLAQAGYKVNHKRVRRLMLSQAHLNRLLGIAFIRICYEE